MVDDQVDPWEKMRERSGGGRPIHRNPVESGMVGRALDTLDTTLPPPTTTHRTGTCLPPTPRHQQWPRKRDREQRERETERNDSEVPSLRSVTKSDPSTEDTREGGEVSTDSSHSRHRRQPTSLLIKRCPDATSIRINAVYSGNNPE
mmetsp:Transcript_31444/g.49223  ORF Transcript_31444/g.49223 Transcript_31444/m.49223 type:complete len:147 (+) Transcript_31444:46-486(+)